MRRGSAAAFAALELHLRHRLVGRLQGEYAGRRLGRGSEPEEVVRYRPGEDDVRRIDWNVTARSQEPHLWRTQADHELDTWVLLDETPSMSFGTAELEKADVAREAVAALGILVDGPGNRLGTVRLRSDGLVRSKPLPGRLAAHRVLRGDRDPAHAPMSSGPNGRRGAETAGLAVGLAALARERRPGLRVVVTDFVEPDGRLHRPFPWEPALRRIAVRQDALVLEIVDPRELALPDIGPVVLMDPETGRRREVWTSLPRLRESYAEGAALHRAQVAVAVRAARADHVVLRTDRDWVADLARAIVRRRGRGPRRHS